MLQPVIKRELKRVSVNDQGVRRRRRFVILPCSFQLVIGTMLSKHGKLFIKLRLTRIQTLIFGLENDEIHVVFQQVARETDVDGCLNLVASEHPQLDTSLRKKLDGIRHTVLQPVLNGCTAQKSELTLNLVRDRIELVFTVLDGSCGEIVLSVPPLVLVFVQLTHRNAQRS